MFEELRALAPSEDLISKKFARRDILKMGLTGFLAATVPLISMDKAFAFAGQTSAWKVSLHNAHTGEKFNEPYRVGNKYLPETFQRMNYFLRDFRTHELFPMDPHVVDLVSIIQRKMNTGHSLEVLSGYRSPKTNAMLREESRGVAKNSLHMYGQAIDIRDTQYGTRRIRALACSLRAGGVGFYPKSDFVHVDTGAVRTW